ncbi:MAG: hypothetical protein QNJ07_01760 [Woeseiaceae bacterium]|nr:hypothetical protein [Woeseiaceae bacterium]
MRWLRICAFLFAGVALFLVLYGWHLATPQVDYLLERRGVLTGAEVSDAETDAGVSQYASLSSSTGLAVDLRVLRPAGDDPLPVLIMLGGHDTGRDAVDLVGEPDGVAFVALDYPYTADHHPDGFWESLAIVDDVQRAFLDSPPALSLALDWLLEQPWVDPDRVNLIGLSLGVPFTAPAGALDERFSRVFLLHGGGDNLEWVMHVGRKSIENEALRRLVARGALLLVYGNTFDTVHWIAETAPRPVVLVMARDDDYVPEAAQRPLEELAESDHVELIWTEGLHIGPERTFELQQLLRTVLARVD